MNGGGEDGAFAGERDGGFGAGGRRLSGADAMDEARGEIIGMTDGLSAVEQAIYCALATERYAYPAYSGNYGAELASLIGQPNDYARAELERRISEALTWDSRIEGVEDFSFETRGGVVSAAFTVRTIYGAVRAEKELV